MSPSSLYKSARTELRTVRDVVRFATSRFTENRLSFGHGLASAFDEAVYLVLHALHLPNDELTPFLDARITREEMRSVLALIEERTEKRIPAAYLTGEAWLGPFRFEVDRNTIVPRSFIAELLDDALEPWVADPTAVANVLDLCTGSGCLAIVAAHVFPNAQVDAVDLSGPALAVAQRNVDSYGLSERVRVVHSDLFAALGKKRYDVILTNPPYVTDASMAALPPEYRHEPAMALAGGIDGLNLVRRILTDARAHLRGNKAILVVEVGHEARECRRGVRTTAVDLADDVGR